MTYDNTAEVIREATSVPPSGPGFVDSSPVDAPLPPWLTEATDAKTKAAR